MSVAGNVFRLGVVASAVVLTLAGCGGGGDTVVADAGNTGNNNTGNNTPLAASLSGQTYKGPTAGATVCAYVIDNAAADRKGAKVQAQAASTPSVADGCVVTANDGTFTLVLPTDAAGDLIVESSGGTYCSDESVFNGTACAGGGTPIAMGGGKLLTVVAAPASGVVANVPLTLLTTAAVQSAGALSTGSFGTAYATVAAGFGLSNTTPSTSPASGELQTALAALATYLGGDTTLLEGVVAGIAGGTITAGSGDVSAPAEFDCEPLAATDLQYTGTYMTSMPNPDPMMPPIMMPMPYTVQSYGFGNACTNSADGLSSVTTGYWFNTGIGTLLGGTEFAGTYREYNYTGSCTDEGRTYVSEVDAPMTVQYMGTQAIARSASADPLKAQEGTASKLRVTLQTGGTLQLPQASTRNHLFCRTKPADAMTVNFQGYMTATGSPEKDGSLSRLEAAATPYTGWSD